MSIMPSQTVHPIAMKLSWWGLGKERFLNYYEQNETKKVLNIIR